MKTSTFAISAILSAGLAFAASAGTVIKIGHGAAETFHMHRALLKFEELVEAGSDGEIDVQIFPSSQMGPDREMIEGVQTGVLEMAICLPPSSRAGIRHLPLSNCPICIPQKRSPGRC